MGINEKINFFPLILAILLVALGVYFLYSAKDINANKKVEKYFSFAKTEKLRNLDKYITWLAKWSKLEAYAIFAISVCLFVDSFIYIPIVLDIITLVFLIALVAVHLYVRIKTPKFYKSADAS